jgi:hypothetical protein
MTRFGLISHSGDDLKVALPDGRQPVTAHLGVSSLIAWRAQNARSRALMRAPNAVMALVGLSGPA